MKKNNNIDSFINKFEKAYDSANMNVREMGEIYVQALKTDPDAGAKFHEKFPLISSTRWERLRLIGHGDIGVEIWHMSDVAAMEALRLRTIDRGKFLKMAESGVDIVSRDGKTIKHVSLGNISKERLDILIDKTKHRLRSQEEQRKYVEKKYKQKKASDAASLPYYPDGSVIRVTRSGIFGITDVRNMLLDLFNGDAIAAAQFVVGDVAHIIIQNVKA